MKCWVKIAGAVLLLALLGADVGLQTVRVLGRAPPPIQTPRVDGLSDSAKTTDVLQAGSAVAVAFFTLGLLVVGWQQSKILKEQHELSKRQAAIAERLQAPVITIEINAPGIEVASAGLPYYRPGNLEYCFVNHSQVPVFLLAAEEVFHAVKTGGGLPAPMSPKDRSIRPMSSGVIVPPTGRSDPMNKNLFPLLLGPQQDAFYTTKVKLFLTTFARFEDLFGAHWIMGLCYIYDDLAQTWVIARGTRDHNYFRREL